MMERGDALIRYLPKDTKLISVEIGVLAGELSSYLLKQLPKLTLHLVDCWKASKNSAYFRSQKSLNESLILTINRTQFAESRRHIHKLYSQEAAKLFEDESIDFIFLDANHTYKAVLQDLKDWVPKVKFGGLISGHDYGKIDMNRCIKKTGVKQAVREYFNTSVELGSNTTWFTNK